MPSLPPERLAELRLWFRQCRARGSGFPPIQFEEAEALLDAAEERDRLKTERDDLGIACSMYEDAIDRLKTFVDEEYGLQPVQESADQLLSTLEQLAFERRQRHEVERKELDRLRQRVRELEEEARLDKGAFALAGNYIRTINTLEHATLTSIARMNWAAMRSQCKTTAYRLYEGVESGRALLEQAAALVGGKGGE